MLRVRVLGSLELELDGENLPLPSSGRARALLGWLALNPGEQRRSAVASLFWPDVLDTSARASLRVALSALRKSLGPRSDEYLLTTKHTVGLASSAWVDLHELRRLAQADRHTEALGLVRGELLPGLDDEWVFGERDRHLAEVAEVLARLAAEADDDGDLPTAIAHTRRQLDLDPLSEAAARDLISRLAASGDRSAALRTYEQLRERLRTQLGIVPSPATRELAATVKTQEGRDAEAATEREMPAGGLPLPRGITAAGEGAFVGRQPDLDRLRALPASASANGLQLAFVSGEPGIGKTRLAVEAAREAHRAGTAVLYGRCYEESVVPHQPFVEALGHHVRHRPKLPEQLRAYEPYLARLLPQLDRHRDPAASGDGREGDRYHLFEAASALLATAARDAPLLLVLDDLHWADDSTLLMLSHIVRARADAAVAILGTFRESELAGHPLERTLGDLARERPFLHVSLAGLSEPAVHQLVTARAGEDIPTELARAIYEQTQGSPFFVEEVTRHLTESGALARAAGSPTALAELGVPKGVRHVVARRLSRLSEDANRVLRVAAVIGRDFDFELLDHISDLEGAGLERALDDALAARLIVESPERVGEFTFPHALVRQVLYQDLSSLRRARLHQRIGETLEDLRASDTSAVASQLAHHFLNSPPAEGAGKAVRYSVAAAEAAAAKLAYEDAAGHYASALSALDAAAGDDSLRCDILLALAEMRWSAGDPEGSRETLLEAASSAERLADSKRLAHAAISYGGPYGALTAGIVDPAHIGMLEQTLDDLPGTEAGLRGLALAQLAEALKYAGEPERVRALADDALHEAKRLDDPKTVAQILHRVVWATWSPDNVSERLELTRQIAELGHELGDARLAAIGHSWALSAHLELADIAAADRELEAHEAEAAALREPYRDWAVAQYRVGRTLLSGPLHDVEAQAQSALTLGHEAGNPNAPLIYGVQMLFLRREQGRLGEMRAAVSSFADQYPSIPAWRCALAWTCAELGDGDAARTELSRVVAADLASFPRDQFWVGSMSLLAHTAAFLGESTAAAEIYELLRPHAERVIAFGGFGLWLGSVSHTLGVLARTLGRFDEAVAHFESALEMNNRIGARPWVGHTQYDYAQMLRHRGAVGDEAHGETLLADARATAEELGMTVLAARLAAS